MKLRINFLSFFFYTLLWTILYLLSSYIGGYYIFFYIFITFLLVLNLIHYMVTVNSIYYYQDFSTEHPFKGQQIEYKLTIENRSSFIPCFTVITFNNSLGMDYITPKMPISNSFIYKSSFILPYRGIYKVGMKNILCTDLLKIFTYSKSFWPRTFYVYPKINPLYTLNKLGTGMISGKSDIKSSNYNDYIESIKSYIPGSRSSNISWKHFASTGEPKIKSYNSDESSHCRVFLDRTMLPTERAGSVDDKAVEVYISLLYSNIEQGITTTTNMTNYPVESMIQFKSIYKDSINITFDKTEKEINLEFHEKKYYQGNSLIIITTLESLFFIDMEFILSHPNSTIYVVLDKLNNNTKELFLKNSKKISEMVNIICVE